MLSLTVISANQGETYYTAENYYTTEENQSHSSWWGQGAKSLGLAGQVQGGDFKNLLHGSHPQGHQTLSGRKIDPERHRAGLDLTFSAPKSISLAVLVGGMNRSSRPIAPPSLALWPSLKSAMPKRGCGRRRAGRPLAPVT